MFSIQELKQTCFIPQGKYTLNLLAPKGTPEHVIEFSVSNGVLSAEVTTEHGKQMCTDISINGNRVCWRQFGGTPGTEHFQYDMKLYAGDVMLGDAYRIDVSDDESLESPVVAERMI